MATKLNFWHLLPIGLLLALSGCIKDQCDREVTYITMKPVYLNTADIRADLPRGEAARDLKKPTQFYYYQQTIFIVEYREGIHVIDNANPSAPINKGFIKIAGVENMAIKDGIMYANNYVDLLAMDFSNTLAPVVLHRSEGTFRPNWMDVHSADVIVTYVEEEVTEVLGCEEYGNLIPWRGDFFTTEAFDSGSFSGVRGNSAGGTGTGGSMARFTIIGDYLYTVDDFDLNVISLVQPVQPALVNTVNVGWGIETIFPYENKLFIGSQSGMFIYDNSNPMAPSLMSSFEHARACDPVFVKDNFAYVTLRSGNACQGFINQLDLIDITDLFNPVLVRTFPMQNPHGLTIRDNNLFLCEGEHGLKVFDISQPALLGQRQLAHRQGMHAFDAISLPGQEPITAIIGEDGFYQFKFEGPATGLQQLSRIPINR